MHYAFDKWIERTFPNIVFARYADDLVIHCISQKQAEYVRDMVKKRLNECLLELHPVKTKIVFCTPCRKDIKYKIMNFDFLGYTFRPRAYRM
jgi:RNA-directed DNA polymerase